MSLHPQCFQLLLSLFILAEYHLHGKEKSHVFMIGLTEVVYFEKKEGPGANPEPPLIKKTKENQYPKLQLGSYFKVFSEYPENKLCH